MTVRSDDYYDFYIVKADDESETPVFGPIKRAEAERLVKDGEKVIRKDKEEVIESIESGEVSYETLQSIQEMAKSVKNWGWLWTNRAWHF